jgi:hypothetical protein
MSISNERRNASRWQSIGWFFLLWAGGVVVTLAISSVFKLLILGIVEHVS